MGKEKYGKSDTVDAVYENSEFTNKNPFIEAMPKLMGKIEFEKKIESYPPLPYNLLEMSREKRREQVLLINELFVPMNYMYEVYDFLYRGICLNYKTKNTTDYVKKINILYHSRSAEKEVGEFYTTQSFSGAILGVPGIGKTSTIRRSLSLIPQVISHEQYAGELFYCKQIVYLVVECPHDCSVKTLAYSIIAEIDKATGSDYLNRLFSPDGISSSSLAIKVKIICLNNHVGIIVIDEIQNAIRTARKNRQERPLIKFLVELTNEGCVSLCFTGTLDADDLFGREEHLMRRTEGYRLLPLKRNRTFYDFLEKIWPYQMTIKKAEFNERMVNCIYDYSKGIPSYVIKIFQETQIQAILSGEEIISESMIKYVANKSHITPCEFYQEGTSISDFFSLDSAETKELYKSRVGRPITSRDQDDLIVILNSTSNVNQFIEKLKEEKLIEFLGGII